MLLLCVVLMAAPAKKPPAVDLKALSAELVKQHGEAARARVEQGLKQVQSLWKAEDGDLAAFVKEHFVSEQAELDKLFDRYEANLEQIDGHMLEIGRECRKASELDLGPQLKVDPLFAAYDPSARVTEDLFGTKAAFAALLNFPVSTLDQRTAEGAGWTRRQWAEARLTGRFARRIPGDIQAGISAATSAGDLYVADYNVWMHHLVDEKGARLFPKGKRLISHWNLRDELKANYADADGLAKQRTIVKVMERIVTQTIPAAVIDNPRVDWNPFTNAVTATPEAELETDAPKRPVTTDAKAEADVRYQKLWANFAASRLADPYAPATPTAIERAFALGAEMPEARVKGLLEEVLKSPLVGQVGAEIQKKLGRPLEPQDLWFNGFVARGAISEEKLDALTRKRYPTADAFAKDIPRILKELGFAADRAQYLADRIKVDPARGQGHALQSARRGDFPHLRTRVGKDGMDYKGYNIAVHELGHNVEQVFSLYDVDHTLLSGVPNTAFTEALAFVFQAKDLELLGQAKPDAETERLRVLNDFWMTFEIAGVALVDVGVWHWMYEHPKATPKELREATVALSRQVWNQYYAPVLGGKDTAILGIYSHMISYPLYLFNYPLGHLIAFQIEEQVRKAGKLGPEFERMARFGSVAPDLWMKNAAGEPVSAGPLLRATTAALGRPASN
ncbi:MAG: hypothetical protein K1X89_08660 [Myxococcaceae bacterium]|nr:hypothetical protein [Myxococcaceae bacterium]